MVVLHCSYANRVDYSLGLSRDALQVWKSDINHALANKVRQYSTLPVSDAARRNTVWGDEAVPNVLAHPMHGEHDHLQVPATGASLGRSMSARRLGLRPEVPHGMDSARTSVITLLDKPVPPSAASTVTLFEPESTFDPDAASTPYDKNSGYPYSRKYQAAAMPQPVSRRSSIVYIKSPGEDRRPEPVTVSTDRVEDPTDSTQWPTRAVKPLIPKSSKLQRKLSSSEAPSSSPGGGLRPLSLLRDRDTNKDSGDDAVASKSAGTRPLLLGKKKPKVKVTRSDENVDSTGSGNKYLKPLQIHRSDSSRIRGLLRKDEVVPSVVIRPPSSSDHLGPIYEYP